MFNTESLRKQYHSKFELKFSSVVANLRLKNVDSIQRMSLDEKTTMITSALEQIQLRNGGIFLHFFTSDTH